MVRVRIYTRNVVWMETQFVFVFFVFFKEILASYENSYIFKLWSLMDSLQIVWLVMMSYWFFYFLMKQFYSIDIATVLLMSSALLSPTFFHNFYNPHLKPSRISPLSMWCCSKHSENCSHVSCHEFMSCADVSSMPHNWLYLTWAFCCDSGPISTPSPPWHITYLIVFTCNTKLVRD